MELAFLSSFWFWTILMVYIVALWVSEDIGSVTTSLVGTLLMSLFLYWFFNADLIRLMGDPSVVDIGCCIAAYVLVGVAWGIFKWYIYCVKQAKKYKLAKTKLIKLYKGDPDAPLTLQMMNTYEYRDLPQKPVLSEMTSFVINWMMFWPVSMLSFAMNDLVVGFYNKIYGLIAGCLEGIAAHVWKSNGIDGE